ncbi:MAG: homoserine dehydrogenase [Actinomycetota bacterium]
MSEREAGRSVRVGFLGCGTVGAAAVRMIAKHASELEERTGARIEIARIATRILRDDGDLDVSPDVCTTDVSRVVAADDIDVVVELMGGIDPARVLITEALGRGKHVISANKELLASYGSELMEAAEAGGADLLFEGAVGGGIPLIRPMKESLAGDRVRRIMGIMNGTTNFILTRMSETGVSFSDALEEATRLGYAEADPSADVDGHDAASKLAILASLAFHARVVATDVTREGVTAITAQDISAAHDLGYEVKLLAVAENLSGRVSARVHPAMIPKTHPLAAVRDVFNAVFVEGEQVGELMFYGRGAGGGPTASAVVGDIVEIARNMASGGRAIGSSYLKHAAHMEEPGSSRVRYYIVLSVADQPGVLAGVAGVFAQHGVSIASLRQEGKGDHANLVLITHTATEAMHNRTFDDLRKLSAVKEIASKMRVEGAPEE